MDEEVKQLEHSVECYLVNKKKLELARDTYRADIKRIKKQKVIFRKNEQQIASLLSRIAMIDVIVHNSPIINVPIKEEVKETKEEG